MRFILVLLTALAVSASAADLQIVRPQVSQEEGGAPDPPGYSHIPGETLFFTCRIANFTRSAESKIHVAYSIQAFDPKGVALDPIYTNEFVDEVGPQDKQWMPKIQTEVSIPPLALPGAYKIVVKAEDLLAHTTAQVDVPFEVRGHSIEPSDKLTIQNFRFFYGENDPQPMPKPVYHPGQGVWVKMDITGFAYGPGNKIDVSYQTSFLNATGKLLWTQPEPAVEQTESFYPKRYIPAEFGVTLDKNIKPGVYTIQVQVKDAVGSQSYEGKETFTVE
ncbi:MAG TPA: hypothetical protein VLW65_14780 [Bryobacteraceae bacterium]|nr:hypothetical protein [Bryobacteraceae bacterium]